LLSPYSLLSPARPMHQADDFAVVSIVYFTTGFFQAPRCQPVKAAAVDGS
jgi:hypothetical protein